MSAATGGASAGASAAASAAASPTTMDPFLMLEFVKPREKLSTIGTIGRAFGAVTNDRLNSNEKTILSSSKVLKPEVVFGRYAYLRESLLGRHGAELPSQIRNVFAEIDAFKGLMFANYRAVLAGLRPSDVSLSIKDLIKLILKVEMLEHPKSVYIPDLQELLRFVYYAYDLYREKMKERGIEIAKVERETRRILAAMPAVPTRNVGAKSLEARLANLSKRGGRRGTRRGQRRAKRRSTRRRSA